MREIMEDISKGYIPIKTSPEHIKPFRFQSGGTRNRAIADLHRFVRNRLGKSFFQVLFFLIVFFIMDYCILILVG